MTARGGKEGERAGSMCKGERMEEKERKGENRR